MSTFGVNIKIKDLFFRPEKVIKGLNAANRKVLSKAGAFIRTAARSSIKTRSYNSTSKPGDPPFDHAGFALARENKKRKAAGLDRRKAAVFGKGIRAILFGYDASRKSVVIGPLRFGGTRGSSTVPHTLEFGGTVQTNIARIQKGGRDASGRFLNDKKIYGPLRTAPFPARPFMAPALKKELPNLPARWRASVSA